MNHATNLLDLGNTYNMVIFLRYCIGTLTDTFQNTQIPKVQLLKHPERALLPPMVLSWNSWNWPLTKRSTKLDFPTADSPSSTSLNWQILFATVAPLGLVAPPPRPAIDKDSNCQGQDGLKLQVNVKAWRWEQSPDKQALMVRPRPETKLPGGKNRIRWAAVE